jgi:hypothetical protein
MAFCVQESRKPKGKYNCCNKLHRATSAGRCATDEEFLAGYYMLPDKTGHRAYQAHNLKERMAQRAGV